MRAVPAVADGLPQGKVITPPAAQTAALVARLAEVKAAERQIDPICAPHPRSAAGPVAMQNESLFASSLKERGRVKGSFPGVFTGFWLSAGVRD